MSSRQFCLTIDVEPDAGPAWKTTDPITFRGVREGIDRLQRLCDSYGVKPTYLLNPVVIRDTESVAFLHSLGTTRAELGTHLHGDYVEPQARYPGPDFSGADPADMQCEYRPEIEMAKLKTLTELFRSTFNRSPKSFRAGRFGARGWTLYCLKQLGYTHDTSVTPFRNWYGKADFSKAKHLAPYTASGNNILEEGEQGVIEVPVTITPDQAWLRPTPGFSDFAKMKSVVDWYESHVPGAVLCSMFHNVELVPGLSPYNATAAGCDRMKDDLKRLFDYLQSRQYQFVRLSDVQPAREVVHG